MIRRERQLKEIFEASGWHVQPAQPSDVERDFVVVKDHQRYAVELRFAREARRTLLEGVLASAILRARAAARAANAAPLAVVYAPSISDPLLAELDDYVRRFGEGAAWGAMDSSGLAMFRGPGLDEVRGERRHVRGSLAMARRSSDVVSDLGQWMIKVLLSHRLPPELRLHSPVHGARIDRPVAHAMALAKLAGASVATASRFVAAMKEERFLVGGTALELMREGELLERWRSALKRRPVELRARWLFSRKQPLQHLDDLLRARPQQPGERACLGLFAACDRLGFHFVSGVAPHLYLEQRSPEALSALGLRVAEPGESADVLIREPRFPEAVFRGALRRDGVPVTDVLQCWVDLADHPARGEEMAAHLFERVIQPSIIEHAR